MTLSQLLREALRARESKAKSVYLLLGVDEFLEFVDVLSNKECDDSSLEEILKNAKVGTIKTLDKEEITKILNNIKRGQK
ncbi:hypothetical protein [Nitrosophilus kaiyonis]|uniref:hypothetical protein n=1 Tax=Nitrosophilus kaiyonis TaxID=2930200 RepID=UPI002491534B|nr:hypothetical protein [Nitrosophilus kaiyonis]